MEFQEQYILIKNFIQGSDVQIRYYGIIVVTAMLVAAWVAARLAQRRKLNPDHIWGGLTWAIFPGIIGARLWYVVFPPASQLAGCASGGQPCMDLAWMLANIGNLNNGPLAIWSGGLSIFGAVLGGFLGAWLYCSRYHNSVAKFFYYLFIPFTFIFGIIEWIFTTIWQRVRGKAAEPYKLQGFKTDFPNEGMAIAPWMDIAGVVLPLAQAIGRWANYVNKELYGLPTDFFMGIEIPQEHRVGAYASGVEYPFTGENATRFHPLFLYESLWNLLAFFVLLSIYSWSRRTIEPKAGLQRVLFRFAHTLHEGDLFLLYVMQYMFVRFLLEFIRVEVAYLPGTTINSSQAFCAVVFVITLGVFMMRRNMPKAAESTPELTPASNDKPAAS